MVNTDKVRVVLHFISTTVDALHRAHDALLRKRFDEIDLEYITRQVDVATLVLTHAAVEWQAVVRDLLARRGGAA